MKHYFAYGTLLDLESMRSITPSATVAGLMKLEGYRMGFAKCSDLKSGGCTLVKEAGATLYGIQYVLSDEDMTTLNKAAGVDSDLWRPLAIEVIDEADNRVPSITYFIPNPSGDYQPSNDYVRPILQGLAARPFPPAYVTKMHEIIKHAQEG